MKSDRGFTLIELLVVLAVVAFIATLAAPVLYRSLPGVTLRADTQKLQSALYQARASAISRNEEVIFLLDGRSNKFFVRPGDLEGDLPDSVTLTLTTARQEISGEQEGSIRFFADGTSTGGEIHLSSVDQTATIRVDWLTGEISRED